MESSFTDAEKRFILAEMVKVSQMDVGVLVEFIKSHRVEPDWLLMQLPGGRNMSQCLRAAEFMFNEPMPPPVISPLKRKSLGDLPDHISKRQAVGPSGDLSPRVFPPSANMPQPVPGGPPVNIQPRPNGHAQAPLPPLAPSPSVSAAPYNPVPTGRRRGRPPKSTQNTWQVSTYPPISPAPIAPAPWPTNAPRPHSPAPRAYPGLQTAVQGATDPQLKKALAEIAPRPPQAIPSSEQAAARSPAPPGQEYQNRHETYHQEYYQPGTAENLARDAPVSTYPPILPRPQSPQPRPHSQESGRPTVTEPIQPRRTPPRASPEPVAKERHNTAPPGLIPSA